MLCNLYRAQGKERFLLLLQFCFIACSPHLSLSLSFRRATRAVVTDLTHNSNAHYCFFLLTSHFT